MVVTDTEGADGAAGSYNSTEQPMPPRFTKMDKMHRVVAKPAGNMLRLKCPAEGIYQLNKPCVMFYNEYILNTV